MPSDINAWTSVAVAAFAAGALWVALRTYRDSFRPVVRVVLRRDPTGDLIPDALILKNIGRGSAMSVTLIEPEPPAGQEWPLTHPGPVVTSVDVVEPSARRWPERRKREWAASRSPSQQLDC